MRAHASLLAAMVAAILILTACTGPRPHGDTGPATQRDTPERGGGDHGGGGGMM
jgi:hypothetical protein